RIFERRIAAYIDTLLPQIPGAVRCAVEQHHIAAESPIEVHGRAPEGVWIPKSPCPHDRPDRLRPSPPVNLPTTLTPQFRLASPCRHPHDRHALGSRIGVVAREEDVEPFGRAIRHGAEISVAPGKEAVASRTIE